MNATSARDSRDRPDRDWFFIAFVAFSVILCAYTGMQRLRFARSLEALATCAAQGEATCAGVALETARAIDERAVRTRLGQAEVRLLLGDADGAKRALDEVVGPDPDSASLDRSARGDMLLLLGDLAAARGQASRAQSRWTEAAVIVDEDALVRPRRDRLARTLADADASASSQLGQLHAAFDKLLASAEAGDYDAVQLEVRDVNMQIRALPSQLARNKLGLAVDAATRAASVARQRKTASDSLGSYNSTAPQPPSDTLRGTPVYARLMDDYRRNLDRWQSMQNDRDRRNNARDSDLATSVSSLLAQARALLDDGMTAAAAAPAPPPSAQTP
jgi:hypothetical protein